MTQRFSVLVPLPFDKAFDYLAPEGLALEIGDYVRVPFGTREVYGVVWGIENHLSHWERSKDTTQLSGEGLLPLSSPSPVSQARRPLPKGEVKLKTILAKAEHLPPMPDALRAVIDWVAWYTLAPKGNVLKMAMSVPDALHAPSSRQKKGVVSRQSPVVSHTKLNPTQQEAADTLLEKLEEGFSVSVLDGVTGSGKTEVYFEMIQRLLSLPLRGSQQSLSAANEIAGGGNLLPPRTENLIIHARKNRSQLTPAERTLWNLLSKRQINGFKFRRQEPIGQYIADFCCYEARIIIEADGSQHADSVHDDCRSDYLASLGFKILRFWNNEILENPSGVIERIREALTPTASANRLCDSPLGGVKNSPQTLVLLPEIALSVQWLQRFQERFGEVPHLWHSGVTPARKRETWRAVARGEAQVVVGARSALFLPFQNLRLIVVDEEHEHSYKQEEGVMYQARDIAVMRAQKEQCPILLVSATPSLETVVNTEQHKYQLLHLPSRHGGATLPEVSLIDMRQNRPPAEHWISEPLKKELLSTLAAGNQAMLFINRRGFAPLVLCKACGHRFGCPHCSAWLVQHKRPARLQCHHCDFRTPVPTHCHECGTAAEDALQACGPGVERLAEEAERAFPDARIGLMTSDSLPTPDAAERLIENVASGAVNLLIGTQMMAKSHHFPNLALVGVIDADLGLAGGDLRAAERSWQLLHQLAGRAGRMKEIKGRVMLQTYNPDHAVMQAMLHHDRDNFIAAEKAGREMAGMPPFGRLAALIVEGKDETEVQATCRMLAKAAPQYRGMQLFGPAPAPLTILRGKYRYRLLLKTAREVNMPRLLREWLEPIKLPRTIRLKIDVDPYSFM